MASGNCGAQRGGLLLLFAVAAHVGCQKTYYEVDLVPKGDSVTRKITAWREREEDGRTVIEELPTEELTRIATAYGKPVPPPSAVKHTYQGRFSGELPDDLQGKGWYVPWESPLGNLTAYSERVRGDIDLAADVADRQAGADELADLIVGWAESEWKDAENYSKLREFLAVELRRDLRNLSLYWWTYTVTAEKPSTGVESAAMRITHYLAERRYVEPTETPFVARAIQQASQGKPHRSLRLVQQLIARKLGREAEKKVPESLEFLADPEKAQASIERYLKSTDQYRALQQQWKKEAALAPDLKPLQPLDVLAEPAARAFPLGPLFPHGDELTVRLALDEPPIFTNGDWDQQKRSVVWKREIPTANNESRLTPTFFYAVWAKPRQTAQEVAFGRVILQGERLAKYCLWYAGLSDDEAQQWDTFVATLRPDENLAEKIGTFRFANEPPFDALPEYEGHAQHAIDLIRSGLDDK